MEFYAVRDRMDKDLVSSTQKRSPLSLSVLSSPEMMPLIFEYNKQLDTRNINNHQPLPAFKNGEKGQPRDKY